MTGLEEEARFISLLQPNRDLATNWTVNVGKELEVYLTELASTGIFDEGQCGLNFAEGFNSDLQQESGVSLCASLASAELLGQKRQEGGSPSSQVDDNDANNVDQEQFLTVDDVEEEANIDLFDEDGGFGTQPAVKLPPCLLTTEGESVESFGGGELASYENATSVMYRTFLLLDPSDTVTVDRYLDGHDDVAERFPPTPGSVMHPRTPRSHRRASPDKTGINTKRTKPDSPIGSVSEDGGAFDCQPNWLGGEDGGTSCDDPAVGTTKDGVDVREAVTVDEAATVKAGVDEYVDPWTPLNPHEPGTLLIKPYKKGLSQRKKPRIIERRVTSRPTAQRNGVCFPEFHEALLAREQSASARGRRSESRQRSGYAKLRESFRERDSSMDKFDDRSARLAEEQSECAPEVDDDWIGSAFGASENFEDEVLENDSNQEQFDTQQQPVPAVDNTQDLGNNETPHMDPPPVNDASEAEEMIFEEMCGAHLDWMLRKLSETHTRTGLSCRVAKWRKKIEATLVEEDTHPPFDIHEYGDRLLLELEGSRPDCDDHEIQNSFTYLVRGQHKEHVARSFSALLQLANNGNVFIDKGNMASGGVCFTAENPFVVKLLSPKKKHERMFDNLIQPRTGRKTPKSRKASDRPQPSAGRLRDERACVAQEGGKHSNNESPCFSGGSRSSVAIFSPLGSVRSRKRRQTVASKRGGSPNKENREVYTPHRVTPVKLTPDGRSRSRRKALMKLGK